MKRLILREEVYEHEVHGTIEVLWDMTDPETPHLIALQADSWTPEEEVQDFMRWAREHGYLCGASTLEGGGSG